MSNSAKRKAAIIGAGLAGTTAGLGLVEAGFDVTIYSDRDRSALRNDVPPTGTAILFGQALEHDSEIIENLYDTGLSTGMSVRIAAGSGDTLAPVLGFDVPFKFNGQVKGQAVDVRLRADDRLGRFLARGGKFNVQAVTPDDVDAIAAAVDLTLIATGKGGLASLFPVDPAHSTYTEPQRHLLLATFKGLNRADSAFAYRSSDGGHHNILNIHAEYGEAFFGPYQHKDIGASWTFLGFARPGSPWIDIFNSAVDTQTVRDAVVTLFATYFPDDAPLIEQTVPLREDKHSWFRGAVSPTVRKAVATTANGHVIASIGDTAIAVDPIAAQGAQNTVVQIALLLRAVKSHDGKFTYDWLNEQFKTHWRYRGEAATEATRLFLGDPKYATHAELILPAAAVNADVGSAFFSLLHEPQPLLNIQTRDDILKFIEDHAGEPAENLLAKFKSPTAFTRAEAPEPVAGS
jgi:Styrene monooxygenase A putative substrate binding domain